MGANGKRKWVHIKDLQIPSPKEKETLNHSSLKSQQHSKNCFTCVTVQTRKLYLLQKIYLLNDRQLMENSE